MRKLQIVLLLTIAALAGAAAAWLLCSRVSSIETVAAMPPSGVAPDGTLTAAAVPRELAGVEKQALSGSAEAAERLVDHYGSCHKRGEVPSPESQFCHREFFYWDRIALENGSPVAAHRLTTKMLYSETCRDARRAEFWFGRYRRAYRDSPNLGHTLKLIRQQLQECR